MPDEHPIDTLSPEKQNEILKTIYDMTYGAPSNDGYVVHDRNRQLPVEYIDWVLSVFYNEDIDPELGSEDPGWPYEENEDGEWIVV